jgi:ABC-type transport system involved in cytochrome c biogenesis ATPase subunit
MTLTYTYLPLYVITYIAHSTCLKPFVTAWRGLQFAAETCRNNKNQLCN